MKLLHLGSIINLFFLLLLKKKKTENFRILVKVLISDNIHHIFFLIIVRFSNFSLRKNHENL